MLMVIKDPLRLRKSFADMGMLSQEQIAAAVPLSTKTVSRMLNGEPVRFGTVSKLATYLKADVTDIAEFVTEN